MVYGLEGHPVMQGNNIMPSVSHYQIVVRYIESHQGDSPEAMAAALVPSLPEYDYAFVLRRVKYWKGIP
ncbi:hypothetical protein CJU90_4006 [Yarrowia sp. C11]|nr:hypothetical protein CJU90_4006 [Yarrowia sp. C11]